MPFPSVTYTFSNSTTADATQVNQDFTDIINGFSDGTKNLNMSAGTFGGTLTASANAVLGSSSSNSVTFNASIASSIPISTNTSYDIGTSTLGLRSIYIGGSSTYTCRIIGGSQSGSYTLTLPTSAGSSKYVFTSDGSGVGSWTSRTALNRNAKSGDYSIANTDDYVPVDASGGAVAITLIAANDTSGKRYIIQKTDSSANAVTITRAGSDTIQGATSIALKYQYETVTLISDGSSIWYYNSDLIQVAACYISVDGATPSSQIIDFNTKIIDTHGAVTTGAGSWVFTVPIAGIYEVIATMYIPAGGSTQYTMTILKNNSVVATALGNSSSPYDGSISSQYLDAFAATNTIYVKTTWGAGLSTTTGANIITIKRVK